MGIIADELNKGTQSNSGVQEATTAKAQVDASPKTYVPPWQKSTTEAAAFGVVAFLMAALCVAAYKGIKWLFSSKSEGAKRIKIVLFASIFVAVIAAIIRDAGVIGALIFGGVIAATVWIALGFKKE